MYAKKHHNSTIKNLNVAYLVLLGIALLDGFYHTTMFLYKDYWFLRLGVDKHSQLDLYFLVIVGTFVFVKSIIQDKFNKKELILSGMLIFTFSMLVIKTGHYHTVLLVAFLIIGARKIDYYIILKEYLILNATFLLTTMLSAKIGIIENLYYTGKGGAWAFGIKYTTDFAAHVFTLVLIYAILRNRKTSYIEIICFYIISFSLYYFCKARLNSGCLFIFATCCLIMKICIPIYKYNFIKKMSDFITKIMVFVAPLFAVVFIGITYSFSDDNMFLSKLNHLFSNRLALGKTGWTKYGISLFGHYIKFVGMEGNTKLKPHYFFIDSSYVMILICYGFVAFILTLIIYMIISERARNMHNYYLLCALAVYALHCMVEHRLLRITYDPFLLSLFAYFPNKKVTQGEGL